MQPIDEHFVKLHLYLHINLSIYLSIYVSLPNAYRCYTVPVCVFHLLHFLFAFWFHLVSPQFPFNPFRFKLSMFVKKLMLIYIYSYVTLQNLYCRLPI